MRSANRRMIATCGSVNAVPRSRRHSSLRTDGHHYVGVTFDNRHCSRFDDLLPSQVDTEYRTALRIMAFRTVQVLWLVFGVQLASAKAMTRPCSSRSGTSGDYGTCRKAVARIARFDKSTELKNPRRILLHQRCLTACPTNRAPIRSESARSIHC